MFTELMASGSGGGSIWTDIKTSSATGTLEYKSLGNGIFAIHADLGNGAGSAGTYKEIGQLPSGAYDTTRNIYIYGMNGGLRFAGFKIDTSGKLLFYVQSGDSNTQCLCDTIYAL